MQNFTFSLQRFVSEISDLETSLDRLNTADDFAKFIDVLYNTEKNLINDAKTPDKTDEFFDTVSTLITIFDTFGTKIPTAGLASEMASFITTNNRALEIAKNEALKEHISGDLIKQEYLNAIVPTIIDIVGEIAKTASYFFPPVTMLVSTPYIGLADTTTALLKAKYETFIDPSQDLYDTFMDEWYGYIDDLFIVIGEAITSKVSSKLTSLSYSGAAFVMGYSDGTTNMCIVSKNITNYEDHVNITGDPEDNYIYNEGNNLQINAAGGNDSITNKGSNVGIYGSGGNDYIENNGSSVTILGGSGNDIISSSGNNVTVRGGDGNDRLSGSKIIDGGNGDDYISGGSSGTIIGGKGNDSINSGNRNNFISYSIGDDSDIIFSFGMTDTLSIAGGGYVTTASNGEIIIQFETDSILLKTRPKILNLFFSEGSDTKAALYVTGTDDVNVVENSLDGSQIKLKGGNDSIKNYGENSLIDCGEGNDSIDNYYGNNVTIDSGKGNDKVINRGNNVSVNTGTGEDNIQSYGGENVTIDSGDNNDTISNTASYISINSGEGEDSIYSSASQVSISAENGNDYIELTNDNYIYTGILADGGNGNDEIHNDNWNAILRGGKGNDSIYNSGQALIDGGEDDDYIGLNLNNNTVYEGYRVSVNGSEGNDTIQNVTGYYGIEYWSEVIMDGGTGNDSIYSSNWHSTITGGTGEDTICYEQIVNPYSWSPEEGIGYAFIDGGNNADIISVRGGTEIWATGGGGDDTIYVESISSNLFFEYSEGDGNDMIFSETASVYITITGETYSRIINGNDVILTVGEDSLTLKDAKDKTITVENEIVSGTVSLLGTTGDDYFYDVSSPIISKGDNSTYDNSIGFIKTFDGNDYIYNTVSGATVLSGADDDSISNNGSKAIINGNTGNDFIDNTAESVSIDGGTDNDYIFNTGSKVSINGGEGNDTIENGDSEWKRYGETVTINGGNGDDVIENVCYDVTINGGDGDDTITNDKNASINGDTGNNLINLTGIPQFGTATINVSNGNDTISINSEITKFTVEEFGEEDVIVFSSAITSLDGSENSLFAAVNNSTVTVEGLTFSQWKLENNVAYYHPDGVSGSYLSDDSLKIYYRDSIISPLLELDGVTDTANFNINGKTVLFDVTGFDSIVSVNNNTGNYNFYFKGTLTTPSTFISTSDNDDIKNVASNIAIKSSDGNDSIDNSGSNSTINGGSGSDTVYNRADNAIINGDSDNDSITNYYAENVTINSGADDDKITNLWSENVIIDGGEGNDSIDNYGEKVSMNGGNDNDTISNYASTVTINGDDGDDYIITSPDLHFSSARSDYVYILGGTGNDTISNEYGGQYVTIEGGSGNDSIKNEGANTLFKYKMGEGNDYITGFNSTSTLSISSDSYSSAKSGDDVIITVGDNNITLNGVANLDEINITRTTLVNETIPVDTISKDEVLIIDKDKISVTLDSIFKVADASKHIKPIQIIGNDLNNSIVSGKGNDTLNGTKGNNTLTGGKGKDIFVHNGGNDTITDYEKGKDKISLDTSLISNFTVNNKDLTLAFGDNTSLTLDNMADKQISFLSGSKTTKITFTNNASLDGSGKNATLIPAATEFSATKYSKLKNINAESVSSAVSIIGNSKPNRIIAGNNGSILNGGKGKDTLFGGNGTDIFIYSNNTGNKIIQNYSPDDIISLTGSQIADAYVKSNNVILKVGNKKLTVKDAANKDITIREDDSTKFFSAGIIYNQDKTSAILPSKFSSKAEIIFDDTVTEINASNARKKLTLTSSNTTGTTIYGGRGKDALTGNSSNDLIYGGKGKDSLYGSAGDDSLFGDKGNDILTGGAGDDSLWGGKGNDTLYGDDGSDMFFYSKGDGKDVIFGFDSTDMLEITGETFSSTYNSSKGEIYFKVGSTNRAITLKDFSVSSFNINGDSYQINGSTLIKK